jgi:hypothetical protein
MSGRRAEVARGRAASSGDHPAETVSLTLRETRFARCTPLTRPLTSWFLAKTLKKLLREVRKFPKIGAEFPNFREEVRVITQKCRVVRELLRVRRELLRVHREEVRVNTRKCPNHTRKFPDFREEVDKIWRFSADRIATGRGSTPIQVTFSVVSARRCSTARLDWTFGRLGRFIVSPAFHAVHHAPDEREYN